MKPLRFMTLSSLILPRRLYTRTDEMRVVSANTTVEFCNDKLTDTKNVLVLRSYNCYIHSPILGVYKLVILF